MIVVVVVVFVFAAVVIVFSFLFLFLVACNCNFPIHSPCSQQRAIMAMHSLSALIAFGEMIIAIVASAYCCYGLCGGSTPAQTMVVSKT